MTWTADRRLTTAIAGPLVAMMMVWIIHPATIMSNYKHLEPKDGGGLIRIGQPGARLAS
jgi:hypothetical protein